ncbi:4'-phosphopantetheinyl transferase family protein (plasmid) [Rhizobium leguminosarum]
MTVTVQREEKCSGVFVSRARLLAEPLQNEVHVWYADPATLQFARQGRQARRLLAPDELDCLGRFRFARDRDAYLATRVLVRRVLSFYRERLPHEWKFVRDVYGRPRVDGNLSTGLSFSLSRTVGLVACAVACTDEIGIDVERVSAAAMLDVADYFFAPAEASELRALPHDRQAERFFQYWTLKESYVKARGLGLTIPLHSFAFLLENRPRVVIAQELLDDAESWQFAQLRPTDRHIVALCIRSRNAAPPRIVPRWCMVALEGP